MNYSPTKTPTKPTTKPGTRPSRTSPVPTKEPSVKPRPKAMINVKHVDESEVVKFLSLTEIESAISNRNNLSPSEKQHLADSIVHHRESSTTAIIGALSEKNYNLAFAIQLQHQKSQKV